MASKIDYNPFFKGKNRDYQSPYRLQNIDEDLFDFFNILKIKDVRKKYSRILPSVKARRRLINQRRRAYMNCHKDYRFTDFIKLIIKEHEKMTFQPLNIMIESYYTPTKFYENNIFSLLDNPLPVSAYIGDRRFEYRDHFSIRNPLLFFAPTHRGLRERVRKYKDFASMTESIHKVELLQPDWNEEVWNSYYDMRFLIPLYNIYGKIPILAKEYRNPLIKYRDMNYPYFEIDLFNTLAGIERVSIHRILRHIKEKYKDLDRSLYDTVIRQAFEIQDQRKTIPDDHEIKELTEEESQQLTLARPERILFANIGDDIPLSLIEELGPELINLEEVRDEPNEIIESPADEKVVDVEINENGTIDFDIEMFVHIGSDKEQFQFFIRKQQTKGLIIDYKNPGIAYLSEERRSEAGYKELDKDCLDYLLPIQYQAFYEEILKRVDDRDRSLHEDIIAIENLYIKVDSFWNIDREISQILAFIRNLNIRQLLIALSRNFLNSEKFEDTEQSDEGNFLGDEDSAED